MNIKTALIIMLVSALLTGAALAGTIKEGKILEYSDTKDTVRVWLTDLNGNKITDSGTTWDIGRSISVTEKSDNINWKYMGQLKKPDEVPKKGGGMQSSPDILQETVKQGKTGEIAILSIEAIQGQVGGYFLQDIMDAIYFKVGINYTVIIPDVFADTDGNGILGTGDVLYSLVDLNTFLQSQPTVQPYEIYTLVNGMCNELPGMMFSTTPFTFDTAAGFTGTPFGGSGTTGVGLAHHGLVAVVPEPSTWLLFATAIFGLLGYGSHNSKGDRSTVRLGKDA